MSIEAAALGLQQAATQQTIALSMLKQNAKAQQQIANVVAQGAANITASSRGQIVDLSV